MDLFEWGDVIDQRKKLDRLLRVPVPVKDHGVEFKSLIAKFTDEDEEMFYNMMRRLKIITEVLRERLEEGGLPPVWPLTETQGETCAHGQVLHRQ